jgi:hypothetical protein
LIEGLKLSMCQASSQSHGNGGTHLFAEPQLVDEG